MLRERLGLTGTNVGCDTSSCGACTVLVNGESVKSCTMLGSRPTGWRSRRSRASRRNGELHPVQQAFHDHHALQCGYCTPGMVLAAVSLIESGDATDEAAIREGSKGNLCRCTGYHNIVEGGCVGSGGGVMTATETAQPYVGYVRQAQGGRLAPARTRHLRRQPDAARRPSTWRSSAARTRTPGSTA